MIKDNTINHIKEKQKMIKICHPITYNKLVELFNYCIRFDIKQNYREITMLFIYLFYKA